MEGGNKIRMMYPQTIRIGRRYSEWRISAYECEVDSQGISYKLGRTGKPKYVTGWYGRFNVKKLQNDIMPKLSQYETSKKRSYPFLITQHRLKDETAAHILSRKKVKFDPRKPATGHTWCAIVLSSTEYKCLSPNII